MAETITADELDVTEETTDSEVEETEEENDQDSEKELLKVELERERAEKEKREARYKSNMKKQAQPKAEVKETKTERKEVDLDSLVERKLMAIEEQRDFVKMYGQETFDAVKTIKEKHPTLSWEDAYKISPVANDPASKNNPDTASMGGRANVPSNSRTITQSDLVKLDKTAYRIMKDKINKGEITLKQ